MSESPHVLFCFQLHRIEERIVYRVLERGSSVNFPHNEKRGAHLTACEHEILPYEDTEFVTDIVEDVWFVDASTPDTNHVLVPGDQELEPFYVFIISNPMVIGQSVCGMKRDIRTLLESCRLGSS